MKNIKISNLNFGYDESNIIFKNASLELLSGDRVCLLGENGTGKTTLLKILSNIIPCEMTLDFCEEKNTFVKNQISNIGFIADKPFLYEDLTGLENIKFYANLFNTDKPVYISLVKKLCKEFSLKDSLNTKVREYSLGMKHKLFFALIVSRNLKLILLDEPLNAFDKDSRSIALTELKKMSHKGCFMMFTTHSREVQEAISNKYFEIRNKKIEVLKNYMRGDIVNEI